MQREPIKHEYLKRQKKAGNLSIVQSGTQETQRATPVHRRAGNIERKPSNGRVHQDAKVISEIGACDTKRPHTRNDKDIACSEQSVGDVGLVDGFVEWLVLEGFEVEMVTEDA